MEELDVLRQLAVRDSAFVKLTLSGVCVCAIITGIMGMTPIVTINDASSGERLLINLSQFLLNY
jgi:hypothetical protein